MMTIPEPPAPPTCDTGRFDPAPPPPPVFVLPAPPAALLVAVPPPFKNIKMKKS